MNCPIIPASYIFEKNIFFNNHSMLLAEIRHFDHVAWSLKELA
jgi:hypothetical protein